jgi:two-component system, NarL family, sensor kinase
MYTNETRIYITVLTGVFILVALVIFFAITIVRYQRKKVAGHLTSVREQFTYLDEERERIAADLHDDLGASLSAIKLWLQRLKNLDKESASVISFSQLHLDEAMQKLRNTSFNLMPGVLQREGLNEALKDLIDLMIYPTSIKVDYHCEIDHFDKRKSLHIYRIAQEILNNIVKHANATRVAFNIYAVKNNIVLHIADDGKGFDINKIKKENKGSGLKNILARADILQAKIYLTAQEEKGVDYLIEIPE